MGSSNDLIDIAIDHVKKKKESDKGLVTEIF